MGWIKRPASAPASQTVSRRDEETGIESEIQTGIEEISEVDRNRNRDMPTNIEVRKDLLNLDHRNGLRSDCRLFFSGMFFLLWYRGVSRSPRFHMSLRRLRFFLSKVEIRLLEADHPRSDNQEKWSGSPRPNNTCQCHRPVALPDAARLDIFKSLAYNQLRSRYQL